MTAATRPRRLPLRREKKPTGPLSAMTQFTPPEWTAVTAWLSRWIDKAPDPPGLFIEDDAMPVLRRLLAKARRTRRRDNLSIRVNREEAAALYYQFLFWECCRDEFPEHIRAEMPTPPFFSSLVGEAEGSCLELGLRPDGTTAW